MNEITEQEVKSLVDRIGPSINPDPNSLCNFTYIPQFPETRKDFCAVKRTAEDGHSYGFDTVYLLWKTPLLNHEKLVDTKSTKDYLYIDGISEDESEIVVIISNGAGSYSGSSWSKEYRRSKKDLGLE